jgi:hypothetical protein
MAGTVTKGESIWDSVKKIAFAWTSGTGGSAGMADAVTDNAYCGQVKRAVFIPGTAGDQPTNLYDVRILDSDLVDILGGLGIDLSNAATVEAFEGSASKNLNHMFAHSKLTLEVRNAGDTKKGTVILYIR